MLRSHFARPVLILGIMVTLVAPPSWAAPLRPTSEPASEVGWQNLAQVWTLLARVWEKAGCIIDPHGASVCIAPPREEVTAAPPPESEAGCIIDPHGSCYR